MTLMPMLPTMATNRGEGGSILGGGGEVGGERGMQIPDRHPEITGFRGWGLLSEITHTGLRLVLLGFGFGCDEPV